MPIVVYYPDTGLIQQIVGDPINPIVADFHRKSGLGVIEIDYQKSMVVDGRFVPKPDMPISVSKTSIKADGTDSVRLDGIPAQAPFLVTFNKERVADGLCNDGEIIITGSVPGEYTVTIHSAAFQDFTTTIKATTP